MRKIIILLLMLGLGFTVNSNAQQVSSAEYFINTDPGPGNGMAIPITTGGSIDESYSISTSGLPQGNHTLYVRTRGDDGLWSLAQPMSFYLQDTVQDIPQIETRSIVAAEYFIDEDPGTGQGIAIPVKKLTGIEGTFSISTNGLAPGAHSVHVRTLDNKGLWSLALERQFAVMPSDLSYPVPYFTHDTVDAGVAMTFTNLSDSVNANTVYEWDIMNDGSVEYTDENITHTFDSTGIFQVKLTVSNDTLSTFYIGNVIVGDFENIMLTADGPLEICEGEMVTLTAPAGYSYEWNTGDTSQQIMVAATGTYYTWLTDANGLAVKSESLSINVTPDFNPVVDIQDAANGMSNGFAQVLLLDNKPDNAYALPSNLQQGLVAYYPFNGNANDESGNGNDGVVHGGILDSDNLGRLKNAYSFSEDANERIEISDAPEYNFSTGDGLSIFAMINPRQLDGNYNEIISKWGIGGFEDDEFEFAVTNNGKLKFFYSTGNGYSAIETEEAIQINSWHAVTITYNRHTLQLKLYIDGVMRVQENVQTFIPNSTNIPIMIGTVGYFTDTYDFEGKIDEVHIYKRALTNNEVNQLFDMNKKSLANSDINNYNFQWSNGDTSNFVSDLAAGDYAVTVTQEACAHELDFTVGNTSINTDTTSATDIIAAEYFFNSDPGAGNGTALNVSYGEKISFQEPVSLDGLPAGSHKFYIRTKGNNGLWSLARSMDIFVQDTSSNQVTDPDRYIVAAEFFVDTDPGVGNGTTIPVASSTQMLSDQIELNEGDYSSGEHTLYVRTQDDTGQWSIASSTPFQVCSTLPETPVISDQSICDGSDITLEASGESGNTFRWFTIDTTLIENANGSTYNTEMLYNDATFFVAQVDANGCQSQLSQVDVEVQQLDVFAGIDEVLSITGPDYQLTSYFPIEGQWSGSSLSATGLLERNNLNDNTFEMTYTVDSAECNFTDTKEITMLDLSQSFEITIEENPLQGLVLAQAGLSDIMSYEVLEGTPEAINVDNSGEITVANPTLFDYETQTVMNWSIEAMKSLQIYHALSLIVNLTDVNDGNSISERSINAQISAYPNPSKGVFNIETEEVLSGSIYQVYDVKGKIITSGIVPVSGKFQLNLNSNGLYLLKITNNEHYSIVRLLKE